MLNYHLTHWLYVRLLTFKPIIWVCLCRIHYTCMSSPSPPLSPCDAAAWKRKFELLQVEYAAVRDFQPNAKGYVGYISPSHNLTPVQGLLLVKSLLAVLCDALWTCFVLHGSWLTRPSAASPMTGRRAAKRLLSKSLSMFVTYGFSLNTGRTLYYDHMTNSTNVYLC